MINNDLNAFDIVHLNSLLHTVERELRGSEIGFRLHGETLQALQAESSIPPMIRDLYRSLACDLVEIKKTIANTRKKYDFAKGYYQSNLLHPDAAPKLSPQALELTFKKIQQINAIEQRFIEDIIEARQALQSKPIQNLVDWSMPFDVDLQVAIEGEPGNFNYSDLDPDNLTVRANYYSIHCDESNSDNKSYNWNTFEHKPGHPLEHCHFGYLLHCLIDHSHFPWWLLHRIVAIHSNVKFSDANIIAQFKSC